MRIVILGCSITSTYRGLIRELCARGHDVLFLERAAPWCEEPGDLESSPRNRRGLYSSLDELRVRFTADVERAHAVIVGSFVPDIPQRRRSMSRRQT